MAESILLLDLTRAELAGMLSRWGEPAYRAAQIREWLFKHLATDPGQMTNLPGPLRARLAAEAIIDPLAPVQEQRSSDRRTVKWLFALPDAETIETVLMHYDRRNTVCISTQAGCAMGCVFCATGQAGLVRNLSAGEIIAQALHAARFLAGAPAGDATRLTHVVVMGMGEPLANYEQTWQALRELTDPDGLGLGARHITVSTVGLPHGIRRLAGEDMQVNLAVSLHAADDALRSRLLPVNQRYPIGEVMEAVAHYVERTRRRVTFEVALMDGVNDAPEAAHELAALLGVLRGPRGGVMCHVNLIPLNPVADCSYRPATPESTARFQTILERRGIPATVRLRRGIDIDAGCGQLRRRAVHSGAIVR